MLTYSNFPIDFSSIAELDNLENTTQRIIGPNYYRNGATFKVVAPYRPDAGYLWHQNGAPIEGALFEKQALLWSSAGSPGAGDYKVVISDSVDGESTLSTKITAGNNYYDFNAIVKEPRLEETKIIVDIDYEDNSINTDTFEWEFDWLLPDNSHVVTEFPELDISDYGEGTYYMTVKFRKFAFNNFNQTVSIKVGGISPREIDDVYKVFSATKHLVVGPWVIQDIRWCKNNNVNWEHVCHETIENTKPDGSLAVRDTCATREAYNAWNNGKRVQDYQTGVIYTSANAIA